MPNGPWKTKKYRTRRPRPEFSIQAWGIPFTDIKRLNIIFCVTIGADESGVSAIACRSSHAIRTFGVNEQASGGLEADCKENFSIKVPDATLPRISASIARYIAN
jgi:hypothetical protein